MRNHGSSSSDKEEMITAMGTAPLAPRKLWGSNEATNVPRSAFSGLTEWHADLPNQGLNL